MKYLAQGYTAKSIRAGIQTQAASLFLPTTYTLPFKYCGCISALGMGNSPTGTSMCILDQVLQLKRPQASSPFSQRQSPGLFMWGHTCALTWPPQTSPSMMSALSAHLCPCVLPAMLCKGARLARSFSFPGRTSSTQTKL